MRTYVAYYGQKQGEPKECPLLNDSLRLSSFSCIAEQVQERRTSGRHDTARCRLVGVDRSAVVVSGVSYT